MRKTQAVTAAILLASTIATAGKADTYLETTNKMISCMVGARDKQQADISDGKLRTVASGYAAKYSTALRDGQSEATAHKIAVSFVDGYFVSDAGTSPDRLRMLNALYLSCLSR